MLSIHTNHPVTNATEAYPAQSPDRSSPIEQVDTFEAICVRVQNPRDLHHLSTVSRFTHAQAKKNKSIQGHFRKLYGEHNIPHRMPELDQNLKVIDWAPLCLEKIQIPGPQTLAQISTATEAFRYYSKSNLRDSYAFSSVEPELQSEAEYPKFLISCLDEQGRILEILHILNPDCSDKNFWKGRFTPCAQLHQAMLNLAQAWSVGFDQVIRDTFHQSKTTTKVIQCAAIAGENALRVVLELGANINEKNSDGNTSLGELVGIPVCSHKLKGANTLISAGADVGYVNSAGETALFRHVNSVVSFVREVVRGRVHNDEAEQVGAYMKNWLETLVVLIQAHADIHQRPSGPSALARLYQIKYKLKYKIYSLHPRSELFNIYLPPIKSAIESLKDAGATS